MIKQSKQRIGELDCVIVQSSEVIAPSAAVVLCHGFGAPATDLVSLASEFIEADDRLANTVYIFPGAPVELDPMFDSRAWWMIDIEKIQQLMERGETREMRGTSPDRLPHCRKMIIQVIDYARKHYSLDASQIVIGGFSQGAMLTTDVALHYAEPLGGLIVWSGALINEPDWQEQAERQQPLSIVQTHGRVDTILPIVGAEDLKTMLVAAGHNVRYKEFHGPHTIPLPGLQLAAQLIAEVVESGKLIKPSAGKSEPD